MKRFALLSFVLACRGSQPPINETLGQTHVTHVDKDSGTKRGTPKADAALPFRKAYSDPGGMWMPSQMALPKHVENFKAMGTSLDATSLSDPLNAPLAAIVSLGGCTGSFVSKDGLIVTNHHCVQGALQYNSSEKDDLVEHGFVAKTKADEKPAGPAARVFVATSFKDVTKEMRDGLDKIKDPTARKEESEKRYKTLIADCEKDKPGIRCSVSGYFRGGLYYLIENLEIRDVRLVYAPERAIGNYGGEIDNWAWPRHTGDWSFYRAYVGKDGKPADQMTADGKLADNVPFQPKHFLKVATDGLKPNDFVMVAGYPGRTNRTQTASETHHDIEWAYPYTIEYSKQKYAMVESHLKDAGETGIKAGVAKQSIQNGLEKYEGILAGMTKGDLLEQKDALDKAIKAWAANEGHEAHKAAIEKLEAMLAEEFRTARVDSDRGAAFGGSRLLSTAISLTRWAEERAKANPERKPGYQDRDMPRAKASAKQFAKSYDRVLDRAGFRLALTRALALPEAQRPWLATLLDAKKGTKIDEAFIDKTLDAWYKAQTIEDVAIRTTLLETGTSKDLKASKDPFVMAAQRIWPIVKAEEKKEDAQAGDLMLLTPYYADAMREVLGGVLAPDANSTLRITYGTVKPLKDGEAAFTSASQIPAKNTGKAPFDAPAAELEAIKAKKFGTYADASLGGDLPIDFLSDLDITGGNSGSPTLNGRGELVGLAFDGNTEGLASDVVFNGATTRTIQVDVRYMLWTMDLISGADHLLVEMGVTPQLK